MDIVWKKLRRGLLRNLFSLVFLFVPIFCLLHLLNSNLPEVSLGNSSGGSYKTVGILKTLEEAGVGELGNMMVAMLPDDLAFTIFVPSEEAFQHYLKLRANDSLTEQKKNDTYAIISRVMGFSAVSRQLPSEAVPLHKELSVDSISGFRLYIWKDLDGTLVVNGVRSERVDLRKAEVVVHKMGGVIMDAEFEQSFSADYED